VECGCPSAELAAGIPSKVFNSDVAEIDFSETHWLSIEGRLSFRVQVVDKHTHPLLSCAVRIYRTSCLPGGLYLDPLSPAFTALPW
jgi:hypothetical protein